MVEKAIEAWLKAGNHPPAAIVCGKNTDVEIPDGYFFICSEFVLPNHLFVMPLQAAVDLHMRSVVAFIEESGEEDNE